MLIFIEVSRSSASKFIAMRGFWVKNRHIAIEGKTYVL